MLNPTLLLLLTELVATYWFVVLFAVQLDLIVDLLGSPVDEEIRSACEPAKAYVRSKGHLSSKLAALYQLSADCDDFVMHLMCQMLTFNPVFDRYVLYISISSSDWAKWVAGWVSNNTDFLHWISLGLQMADFKFCIERACCTRSMPVCFKYEKIHFSLKYNQGAYRSWKVMESDL